jgi:hypothetical protein
MLEKGEFEPAAGELAPLGGVCSADEEVAVLARGAQEGLRDRPPSSRDKRREVLATAVQTSRELFEAGQYHAALSACQKALRIDRHNEEARGLKREIDSALEAIEDVGTDSRIETGFFNIEELGDEG